MYHPNPLHGIKASRPATDYDEALCRLAALQAATTEPLNPLCQTALLTHNAPTAEVVVMLHGFTNCPHQFHQFAPLLHAQGKNVLLVRLPFHGHEDRLSNGLAALTVTALIDCLTEALDIACGLGREVCVIGFSLGGSLAGWAAQKRLDLASAILISPAIGIRAIPAQRRWLIGNLFTLLPNLFRWWNPALKDQRIGPLHAYPRFATRAVAALLRLGLVIVAAAEQRAPLARTIMVITNPSDEVVDNEVTNAVVKSWRAHGAQVVTHTMPAEWNLLHDFFDPAQEEQQVARVYPLLLGWINEVAVQTTN
ncbi:MAG: alpha/beta fold hydrolase [Caldilineaceae bacterium]